MANLTQKKIMGSLLNENLSKILLDANNDFNTNDIVSLISIRRIRESDINYDKRVKQFISLLENFANAAKYNDIKRMNEVRTAIHDHLSSPLYQHTPSIKPYIGGSKGGYVHYDYAQHEENKNYGKTQKMIKSLAKNIKKATLLNEQTQDFLLNIINNVLTSDNLKKIIYAQELEVNIDAQLRTDCISGNKGGNNKIYQISPIRNPETQMIINSSLIPPEGMEVLKKLKNNSCPYLIPTFYETIIEDELLPEGSATIRLMSTATNLYDFAKDKKDEHDSKKLKEVINFSTQMLDCVLWLREFDIFFPDMKLSNFFTTEMNAIVLPDVKTLYPYVVKEYNKNGDKLIQRNTFSSTLEYEPPEVRKEVLPVYNVNHYESYCIGLNIFMLATGAYPDINISRSDLRKGNDLSFDFSHEIFTSDSGKILKSIISNLINQPRLDLTEAKTMLADLELHLKETKKMTHSNPLSMHGLFKPKTEKEKMPLQTSEKKPSPPKH